jgi:purine-binding chemotaxis protein CheW
MEYDERELQSFDAYPQSLLDQVEKMEMPDDAAFAPLAEDATAPIANDANAQSAVLTMYSATTSDLLELPVGFEFMSSTGPEDAELPPLPDSLLDAPGISQMDELSLLADFSLELFAANSKTGSIDIEPEPMSEEIVSTSGFQTELGSTKLDQQLNAKPSSLAGGSSLEKVVADIDSHQAFIPMSDIQSAVAASSTDEDVTEQHVIFTLDNTAYSLPLSHITEIGRPLPITPLPNVPAWALGVSNLRGDIISVVDLRAFLGKSPLVSKRDCRMIVVRSRREDITTALLVDHVREIRRLVSEKITLPTALIEDLSASYMHGVYEHDGRLLVLLEPERLMLSPEMRQFETASG